MSLRTGRIMGIRDRLLKRIGVLVGADAEASPSYLKILAKIAELKETKPELAKELELKCLSFENHCFIIFEMITNPQEDTEIDTSKFTIPKINPSQLPLVDSPTLAEPPAKDSFDPERIEKLLKKSECGFDRPSGYRA